MIKTLLSTAVAAATLSLAGPAVAQGAGELVVWHAYRAAEKAAFEKVVEMFEKSPAAKGTKLSTLAIPYDAYADKISAAVPRGKGPDVFIYAQDRLGGWIEAGNTIEPMSPSSGRMASARPVPPAISDRSLWSTTFGADVVPEVE